MLGSETSDSTTYATAPQRTYEGQGVDTATAMKIVGHKSDKMRKRYHAIEERDLTQAAQKVHKYFQENTRGTLAENIATYSATKCT